MKVSACDATPIRPRFIRKLVIQQRIWGDLCSDKAIWMDMFTLSWISKLSLINQLCCISHGFKIQHGTLPLMPDLKKNMCQKVWGILRPRSYRYIDIVIDVFVAILLRLCLASRHHCSWLQYPPGIAAYLVHSALPKHG